MPERKIWPLAGAVVMAISISGCSPSIKVEPPGEPIQINMNVKIEHEVRVRVERDLEKEFASNPELFGVPVSSE